jgi:hypothetical protein
MEPETDKAYIGSSNTVGEQVMMKDKALCSLDGTNRTPPWFEAFCVSRDIVNGSITSPSCSCLVRVPRRVGGIV